MLEHMINSYNNDAMHIGRQGRLSYVDGWLLIGTVEQFDSGTYQCELVDKQIDGDEAYKVVKALSRALFMR